MDKIKKATKRIGKFVEDHKVGIAVVSTIIVMGKLNKIALRDHDNFLRDKGLYDEFYTFNDE